MGCSRLTNIHHTRICDRMHLILQVQWENNKTETKWAYLSRRLQMSALRDKALQSNCVVTHNDLHEFGESIQGRSLNSIWLWFSISPIASWCQLFGLIESIGAGQPRLLIHNPLSSQDPLRLWLSSRRFSPLDDGVSNSRNVFVVLGEISSTYGLSSTVLCSSYLAKLDASEYFWLWTPKSSQPFWHLLPLVFISPSHCRFPEPSELTRLSSTDAPINFPSGGILLSHCCSAAAQLLETSLRIGIGRR
jgi:hypothetical protein